MKLLFLFNQLLVKQFSSGGDVKGQTIYDFASKDSSFETSVIAPNFASEHFSSSSFYPTGLSVVESIFKREFVPAIFLLYIARAIEASKIVKKLDLDAIYTTGDFFCNVLPAYKYKKLNPEVKWGACVYHINTNPLKRKSNFLLRSIFSYMMQQYSFRLIKKQADVVFVLNGGIIKELKRQGFKNKFVVSALGLDISKIKNTISGFNQTKEDRLVFFNRVNPTKGVFDLPEILALVKKQYPKVHLDVIGFVDDSIKERLLREFSEKGCEKNVTIHGFVESKEDALRIINKAKVFLQTSYEEGWSLVLFEGIMSRTLPVVYDLPIYSEVFKGTLYTAPIGDYQRFGEIVLEVLSLKDGSYKKKLEQAYAIAANYDHKDVYEKEKGAFLSFK